VSLRGPSAKAAAVFAALTGIRAVFGPPLAQEASYDPHRFMLARSHYEKGLKLLARDRESDGEQELLEAVKVFPLLAEAYLELGHLSMKKGDFTQGLERYQHARDALAGWQGMKRLQEAERQRRLQESMDILQERIEDLQRSQRPNDIGKVQQEMVRLEKHKQEKINDQPSEGTPFTPEVHFFIGTALMKLERFEDATREFQQALTLRPRFGEAHNNLAVICLYRKDYAASWEHVHAAEEVGVRVNPQFREELAALLPEPVKAQNHP